MDQDKQPRRVKVTDATAHRAGTKRAAIKPHKRTEVTVKQVISDYMSNLKTKLTQTYYGTTIDKNAAILRNNFGLAATDEPYLLLDVTSGTGKAGVLLSATGIHLADGRGGTVAIAWSDLATTTFGYQSGKLIIGQSSITSRDGQVMAALLQEIKNKNAK